MAKKKIDADPDVEVAGDQWVEEFCVKPVFDEDGVQASSGIGRDGKEYPDPVPTAPPVGFEQAPDLMDMMRRMIRSETYQQKLEAEGFDTFEEAGDYDVDDDPLPPLTPHELILMSAAPPAPTSPPSTASPQVETGKKGGEEAGSPQQPAPAAPSGSPVPQPAAAAPPGSVAPPVRST